MKYYLVTAKLGHIGTSCFISITFPVIADSHRKALALSRSIPFLKNEHKDASFIVDEVTFDEYLMHKVDSSFSSYLPLSYIEYLESLDMENKSEIEILQNQEIHRLGSELEIARSEIRDLENAIKESLIIQTEKPLFNEKSKILLIGGDGKLDETHMNMTLNKLDMPTHCYDWRKCDKLTNFNIRSVEYNRNYSDIIVGHIPHSTEGIGEYSSMVGYLKENQEKFWGQIQVLRKPNGTGLEGFTKTNFKEKVRKSILRKILHNEAPIEIQNDFGDMAV